MNTDKLQKLYNIADKEAIRLLKEYLMFMYNHRGNKFNSIINAMGSTAFYKNEEPLWPHEKKNLMGYEDYCFFLSEWDDIFHLSGYPVKIDKNGLREGNEF